ncbi:hypothetical protein KSU1_A0058 [Candidatus Jettenia caeni]|uniref:Uncharacterized protein n=1 Tax=Candidatus Jettenia caeni TaxID=247490 RepID=I3IGI0_9BACT|nr:hypothetical protein KSU1_A0058 [Candidatus Jettenia caeni]
MSRIIIFILLILSQKNKKDKFLKENQKDFPSFLKGLRQFPPFPKGTKKIFPLS